MTEDPPIPTSSLANFFAGLNCLPPAQRPVFLMSLEPGRRERIVKSWEEFSQSHQREPDFAQSGAPWTTWLILGGRGAGKTRAGAEWVRRQARAPAARIALI